MNDGCSKLRVVPCGAVAAALRSLRLTAPLHVPHPGARDQHALQPVPQNQQQRQALARLVGTSGGLGGLSGGKRRGRACAQSRPAAGYPAPCALHRSLMMPSQSCCALHAAAGAAWAAALTKMPESLSSIQCLGAFKRLRCFLGPACHMQSKGAGAQTSWRRRGCMGRLGRPCSASPNAHRGPS